MAYLIDFVLHIDSHLVTIVNTFGNWTYLILFAIIFIETGAVIMPFLPGDSLLFAACAMAANPNYNLNIWFFVILFLLAPFLGDSLNFFIGHKVGKSLTKNSFFGRFIKEDHLKKTEAFFEKHGGMAISLARFMPIIRTMSPFVFGNFPVVKQHFSLIIIGIIVVSLIPALIGALKAKFGKHDDAEN